MVNKIKRYWLIYDSIKDAKKASKKEICERIRENDLNISSATFDRDLNELRNMHGLDIMVNHENRYFLNNPDYKDVIKFVNFLDISIQNSAITSNVLKDRKLLRHIHFDRPPEARGLEYFGQLVHAITNRLKISIKHYNFFKDEENAIGEVVVRPYMLKEYLNRWYLCGYAEEREGLRNYGMDRIQAVEILSDSFEQNDLNAVIKNFDDIIGIDYNSYSRKEKIIIAVNECQRKYLSAVPLHQSQIGSYQFQGRTVFEFHLKPNFEFRQRILMLGSQVEVMELSFLRQNIKNEFELALKLYQA